jgi:hypothetical protein
MVPCCAERPRYFPDCAAPGGPDRPPGGSTLVTSACPAPVSARLRDDREVLPGGSGLAGGSGTIVHETLPEAPILPVIHRAGRLTVHSRTKCHRHHGCIRNHSSRLAGYRQVMQAPAIRPVRRRWTEPRGRRANAARSTGSPGPPGAARSGRERPAARTRFVRRAHAPRNCRSCRWSRRDSATASSRSGSTSRAVRSSRTSRCVSQARRELARADRQRAGAAGSGTGSDQLKAGMPVMARPMIRMCTSSVPS